MVHLKTLRIWNGRRAPDRLAKSIQVDHQSFITYSSVKMQGFHIRAAPFGIRSPRALVGMGGTRSISDTTPFLCVRVYSGADVIHDRIAFAGKNWKKIFQLRVRGLPRQARGSTSTAS